MTCTHFSATHPLLPSQPRYFGDRSEWALGPRTLGWSLESGVAVGWAEQDRPDEAGQSSSSISLQQGLWYRLEGV